MNRNFFAMVFFAGLSVIVWVGVGFIGKHPLALSMTAIIAICYAVGALELHRFRQTTAGLASALSALPTMSPTLTTLGDWLVRVPASLQSAVRLRVDGERGGFVGTALTPYLVGLLVMLGMLGTFLGLVVTLNGAAFAMEGTTDLQAMRASLTEPIKGLGLAFGTSIAGVAASAMLGLMSTLSRRERLATVQQLDQHIATDLRVFSLTYQRQETFKALQQQAFALPMVATQLEAMMARMESMSQQMSQQLGEHLLSNQARFHDDTKTVYTGLASSIDLSLKESLAQHAQAAIDSVKPLVENTLVSLTSVMQGELTALREGEARRGAEAVERLGELQTALASHLTTLGLALETPIARLIETASDAPRAAAEVIGQLRQEVSNSKARDNLLLDERARIMDTMSTLLASINHAAAEQRAVIDTLVTTTATALSHTSQQFSEQVQRESATLATTSAQVTTSAVEVASLSDAFGFAVKTFTDANQTLVSNLLRIESALDKASVRNDEQLAYYIAQAREIIDLSMKSQKDVVDEMRSLGRQQRRLASELV